VKSVTDGIDFSTENKPVTEEKINRRDMLLIGAGFAALCIGSVADSAFTGTGATETTSLTAAAAQLANVPSQIGNWVSTDSELTEREIQVAGINGYVRREYTNPQTGFSVHLTILCGPAGPMSVHPPTACFEGVGYTLITGPTPTTAKSDSTENSKLAEFNKCTFKQGDSSVPELVRVFWGWGQDGEWTAPASPRIAFRGRSYLYKIYVVDRWLEATGHQSLPQIESFLNDALPVISDALEQPR
jgi:hypothetical protein